MLTISLKRSESSGRNVCRHGATLFSNLTLEQAIRLARVVARNDYRRLRRPICAVTPGNHNWIVLARYARLDTDLATPALAA